MQQLTQSVFSDTSLKSLTKGICRDVAMQVDDLPLPPQLMLPSIKASGSLTLNPNIEYKVLGTNLFNSAKIIWR